MPAMTADEKIRSLQTDVGATLRPAAPISTDNSNGAPPGAISLPQIEVEEPGGAPSGVSPATALQTGTTGREGPQIGTVGGAQGTATSPENSNALPAATVNSNMPDLMDQKIEQLKQSMRADGVEYTPPMDGGANFSVDDQNAAGRAFQDLLAGFNISLARNLSLPRETVDRGLGLLGLDYMQHGSPQQHTIDALNNMGIPAYEVENLANKIGQGALPALATWAAIQLAAPSMAAKQGLGAASYAAREIGNWAQKHPWAGFILGQTSAAGSETAVHATNPQTPLGHMAAEIGGGLAGGVAPGFIKGVATLGLKAIPFSGAMIKGAGMGINGIASVLPTDLANAIKKYNPLYRAPVMSPTGEPLVNSSLDANRVQQFAKDQIFAAQTYQDHAIENAINSIPRTGTPGQIQARTHDLLLQAEKISKRIVSGFWDRVPLKTRVAVRDMRTDAINMRKELVDNDNTRPDKMLDKIIQETAPQRTPTGQFKPTQMTVAKLRDYQSQIGTAITEERAQDAPREGYVRNLARLSEIIDENIARELPNDTTIEQARQMSKRHNDLFSRGPINDILSKRRTGDFRVPTSDSIDTLMQKTDGLAALKAVQEGVSNYPRIPTNRFQPRAYYGTTTAVTPAEKAQLDQLVKSAEDSIRSSFREAAENGPNKAVAYSQKNEEAIKALGGVSGELAWAAQKVSAALTERDAIAKSALARFAQADPEKAVANIFAQKDPADMARQLMVSFRGDRDALEGLRNEVLNRFIYTVGKTNPNIMQRMLQTPKFENMLRAVLSGEQWQRLNNITNTAVRLGVNNELSFREAVRGLAKTAGKIGGALIGRKLETGTLQAPQLVSNRLGNWMDQMFHSTDPQYMLSHAVVDPTWESLLYSKAPTNTREIKAALVKYRRLMTGLNTAQHETLRRFSKDDNNDE